MKISLLELIILQTGTALGAGLFYQQRAIGMGTLVPALEFYADVLIGTSIGLMVCLLRRSKSDLIWPQKTYSA